MQRISNFVRLQCIFMICAAFSLSHVAAAPPDPGLVTTIDKALAEAPLKHGIKGVFVKSLKNGRIFYEKNSDVLFVPASNFKLLVSAAALDTLGPDYKFQTALYATAKPGSDGVLQGDLVLVGGGDPVLRHEHLQAMVDKLKSMGVTAVAGNVVGDDSLFDDIRLGWDWAWDDEPYFYSAQVSALNLGENVVDVWVRPGLKEGEPPVVRLTPPTSYMIVKSDATTGPAGSEKTLTVDRVHGRNTVRVTGSVPIDYKPTAAEETITVEEPTFFACQTLIEMLRRSGIEVSGQPMRGVKPEGADLIATHDSPPLSDVLALLNKPSDNLIAECLFKTLGVRVKGKGSATTAQLVELDFLKKIGADTTGVSIMDGSGLSRQDCITPKNLVTILSYMYRHKDAKVYVDSLPIAGVDGTMKNRLIGTVAAGSVYAKTGYVGKVSTVSGFVTTKTGEPLVFSIMMNNHLCRNKEAMAVQDKIIEALANLTTP